MLVFAICKYFGIFSVWMQSKAFLKSIEQSIAGIAEILNHKVLLTSWFRISAIPAISAINLKLILKKSNNQVMKVQVRETIINY